MIKCCIFDLDGTILNTITTITHFVNSTLHSYGIGSITEDECKYFVGNGATELIRRALLHLGVTDKTIFSDVYASYDKAYNLSPYYLTDKFFGMSELLSELRRRKIKLAVLSNKQNAITKEAVEHFYPGIFDLVLGGRKGVPLKPMPDSAIEICRELLVSPSETCFVGDTGVDIETGKNLGAGLVLGVLWGFRKQEELKDADALAKVPEDILSEIIKFNEDESRRK